MNHPLETKALQPPVICLMGPTACGKTDLALTLATHFPCEIISVDSAMVYRTMDIGTAKPSLEIRHQIPHHLIDIRHPIDTYSAGHFYVDALNAIAAIFARGRIPLLAGGTMLYFRVLQQGIAALPRADSALRQKLQQEGETLGWPLLHARLQKIDPAAALRIQPHDKQRIQRALEVYLLTQKTISAWQQETTCPPAPFRFINLAVLPECRTQLHTQIQKRFQHMIAQGFVDEVKMLYARGDLNLTHASMRSVGYKQVWMYLDQQITYPAMQEQAVAATRQLAKRQITWLRSWPDLQFFLTNEHLNGQVIDYLRRFI